uniref:Uncharacterized protein n=1 Tax=Pseudomonas sp. K-62 TaxID=76885 RepID=I2FG07_9PSED|nr:hypothetical protein [Pseudomonas sp. K-62]
MGEQVSRHELVAAQPGQRALQVSGVPQDDGRDHQVEARGAVLLVLVGAIADLAEAMKEDGPGQAVARLPLVQLVPGRAAQLGVFDPVEHEQRTLHPPDLAQRGRNPILPRMGRELAHDHRGRDGSRPQRRDDAKDIGPMGADEGHVDPAADQGGQGRMVGRLAEAVEAPFRQVGDARCELEAQERAEREDMLGVAAAVGVVPADRDLAAVMEQGIEHVQGLAGGGRDGLREERPVAVRQVGIDLEAGLGTVMGVAASGGTALACRGEELPVGRGRDPRAEGGREGLALLPVDEAAERQPVGFLADMPVRRPGELAEAGDAAGLGHARQAEVQAVGQHAGQDRAGVGRRHAGLQVGEAVREPRPVRDLRQEVGDADTRQHGVEPARQGFGLRRRGLHEGRDLQHAARERHVAQQAGPGPGVDLGQTPVQQRLAAFDEAVEVGFGRQRAGVLHGLPRGRRDQSLLEGAVLPAAADPDLAGQHARPQLGQDAKFVVTPVDAAAGQHVGGPAPLHEAGRGGGRQARRSRPVRLTQHRDGAQERSHGRDALEAESVQKGGRPAAHGGVMRADLLIGVERLRPGQYLGLGDTGAEPLPRDHGGDRREGVLLAGVGGDHRPTDPRIEPDLVVDRACVSLEGTGLPPFGTPEQGTDHPVEEGDHLVGQAGLQVEHGGDQRRVTALPRVAGDVLHGHARGLGGDLRHALRVDPATATGLDAEAAYVAQARDQAEHGGGLGGLRHLPHPREPGLARVFPELCQSIEASAVFGRQAVAQAAVHLPARPMPKVRAEAFQRRGRRQHDATLTTGAQHQVRQGDEPVVVQSRREQHSGELGGGAPAERPQPEMGLTGDRMTLTAPLCRG